MSNDLRCPLTSGGMRVWVKMLLRSAAAAVLAVSSLGVARSIAISCPFSQCLDAITFSTESGDAKVTKPMPRYPCLEWSLGMYASCSLPKLSKYCGAVGKHNAGAVHAR